MQNNTLRASGSKIVILFEKPMGCVYKGVSWVVGSI